MDPTFFCALNGPPYAVWLSRVGTKVHLANVSGQVRFPRVSSKGWIAYHSLPKGVGVKWSSAVVVTEPSGDPIDILPYASPTSPPDWSPQGEKLLLERVNSPGSSTELICYSLDKATERVVLAGPSFRSPLWQDDTHIIYSTGSRIELLDVRTGKVESLYEHTVGSQLEVWGTDDLYLVIDELALSRTDELIVRLAWHQQGRPHRSELHLLYHGTLLPTPRPLAGRFPRWSRDSRLLALATDEGIQVYSANYSPRSMIPVSRLHSFDWCATN
jgi:hypothetical protein